MFVRYVKSGGYRERRSRKGLNACFGYYIVSKVMQDSQLRRTLSPAARSMPFAMEVTAE